MGKAEGDEETDRIHPAGDTHLGQGQGKGKEEGGSQTRKLAHVFTVWREPRMEWPPESR